MNKSENKAIKKRPRRKPKLFSHYPLKFGEAVDSVNSGDTILNSQCRHSPLEFATETRSMKVGDTHDPPLEELRAAYRQENKYGVPEYPGDRVIVFGPETGYVRSREESGLGFTWTLRAARAD